MKLELAARDAAERDPELARELSEVGDELTQVLDDLRQLRSRRVSVCAPGLRP